jgi:hypothetical protein
MRHLLPALTLARNLVLGKSVAEQISFIANSISADLSACGYSPVANSSQPRRCLSMALDTVDRDVHIF